MHGPREEFGGSKSNFTDRLWLNEFILKEFWNFKVMIDCKEIV